MKFCKRCSTSQSISSFSFSSRTKDKLQAFCKKCNKKYYQDNKKRCNELQKIRTKRVWKDHLKRCHIYRTAHKDQYANYAQARRAKLYNQFVEYVDRKKVLNDYNSKCGICNEQITGDFHVDHIIPIVKGGLHSYSNVQPAHPECNLHKHAKLSYMK